MLQAAPETLAVDGQVTSELRYRGIYKVPGYTGQLVLEARWDDLSALQPRPEHLGSTLECEAPTLYAAVSDPAAGSGAAPKCWSTDNCRRRAGHRRHATAAGPARAPAGRAVPAAGGGQPCSPCPPAPPATDLVAPLTAKLTPQSLAGTDRLALVPSPRTARAGACARTGRTSFGGRFPPERRDIGPGGFDANWTVSSLASDAARAVTCKAVRRFAGLDALRPVQRRGAWSV
ncbi:MAG: inner membrane CreD family protein [Rubrivivax sp.]